MKRKLLTMDCTPTWRAVLPLLLHSMTVRDVKSRDIARAELIRMAELADAYNNLVKKKGRKK